MKYLLVALGLSLGSCSQGSFDDEFNRDEFHYGLVGPSTSKDAATVLGKVLKSDGNPAEGAVVQVYGSRMVYVTNSKGGFAIPNLSPGTVELVISKSGVEGTYLKFDVDAGQRSELSQIGLSPMLRIHGNVATDSATASEARVSLLGFAFETGCSESGDYELVVPAGEYQIMVRHLLYQPQTTEPMTIEEDTLLDFELKPHPAPSASVRVRSEDGYVVHGGQVHLEFHKTRSVRAFRLIGTVGAQSQEIEDLKMWQSFEPELVLNFTKGGAMLLNFEFLDAFGVVSEPVGVAFYLNLRPTDWKVMYGTFEDKVVVGAGEKVVLISKTGQIVETTDVSNLGPPTGVRIESRALPGLPLDMSNRSNNVTFGFAFRTSRFMGGLEVHEGAEVTIEGIVEISGELNLKGTSQNPVRFGNRYSVDSHWRTEVDRYSSAIGIVSHGNLLAQHVHFERTDLRFNLLSVKSSLDCKKCYFKDSLIEVNNAEEHSHLYTFVESYFQNSTLYFGNSLVHREPGMTPSQPGSADLNGKVDQKTLLSAEDSTFVNSTIQLRTDSSSLGISSNPASYLPLLRLKRNDFWLTKPGGFYFLVFDERVFTELSCDFEVDNNYFSHPSQLYPSMKDINEWPEIMGQRRSQPFRSISN